MVLLDTSLEKFGATENELSTARAEAKLYEYLDALRNRFFSVQYCANHSHVTEAEKHHEASQQFILALVQGDRDKVQEFLLQSNRGAPSQNSSSTLVLMDATGSMHHLMTNAKATVITMYERATEVLLTNGIASNIFRVQFAVFRNYNSGPDKLLQCSSWATQPQELRAIAAEGGAGNEAIEIGLWLAANEAEKGVVSKVILIGDAPANTDQEIQIRKGAPVKVGQYAVQDSHESRERAAAYERSEHPRERVLCEFKGSDSLCNYCD
jgi:hypothetical protein